MKITFYGVRGSIPTPGIEYTRYGGNTPCIVIENNKGNKLILDAGTGLRIASKEFIQDSDPIHLLLSHHHWDHIQGFPFFEPIYQEGREIFIYPGNTFPRHNSAILEQMDKSYFPVKYHRLPSIINLKNIEFTLNESTEINGFNVTSLVLNHPDGGNAYRINCEDVTLIYATDNELKAPKENCFNSEQAWIDFCSNSDLLIHDAQYCDAEMKIKCGWGHSSITETLDFAEKTKTKNLCLFSHDPTRTDQQLDKYAEKIVSENRPYQLFFAKEGDSFNI